MRTFSLVKRLLRQFMRDKRTMVFVLLAPIFILTLIYFILDEGEDTRWNIGIVNAPQKLEATVKDDNREATIRFIPVERGKIQETMDQEELTLILDMDEELKNVTFFIDGSDFNRSQRAQSMIQQGIFTLLEESNQQEMEGILDSVNQINPLGEPLNMSLAEKPEIRYEYVYGLEDPGFFDKFGAGLIGIIVFLFVYLLGGINFLMERTSGTLEKMLTTPIKRREIIIGYILAFSVLAIFQTLLVSLYLIYVLKVHVMGSVFLVILVNLMTALVALSLGILLSTVAKSEFQLIQFVPVVITPQVFLCGLFEIGGIWEKLSYFIPLKYTVDALKQVMMKGHGLSHIGLNLLILFVLFLLFMLFNIRLLKKQRIL